MSDENPFVSVKSDMEMGHCKKIFDHTKTRITTLYFQDPVGLVLLTTEIQWRP